MATVPVHRAPYVGHLQGNVMKASDLKGRLLLGGYRSRREKKCNRLKRFPAAQLSAVVAVEYGLSVHDYLSAQVVQSFFPTLCPYGFRSWVRQPLRCRHAKLRGERRVLRGVDGEQVELLFVVGTWSYVELCAAPITHTKRRRPVGEACETLFNHTIGGDRTMTFTRPQRTISPILLGLLLVGCSADDPAQAPESAVAEVETYPLKEAYFGDLHVHTNYSFDAFLFGTRRNPDEAYEFAKGGAIEHASGITMQMKKPLDFQAVTDHAFYLGMMPALAAEDGPFADHRLSEIVRGATTPQGSGLAFREVLTNVRRAARGEEVDDDLDNRDVARDAWEKIVASAERHNDPGTFTTFIGYEYTTSGPETQNLHRNVIFEGSQAPALPFSRLDSLNPEDLWTWMDGNRANGMDSVAIPHNSNGSDGWMFQTTQWDGSPIDAAYAANRMRNEPLVENTQVKGTSDTHPLLSPNDEWADYEIMPWKVATTQPSQAPGSYVRDAYLRGLVMEEVGGFNPYRFGVIGSSDTHNAAGSFEEDNYWSKTGINDIAPQQRGSVPLDASGADGEPLDQGAFRDEVGDSAKYANAASKYWGASGLAGVWAESNTRDAIFNAFRRKETFSTSGPHIKVRFFGGYGLDEGLPSDPDAIAKAYDSGVPMGSDLLAGEGQAPNFFAWALRDADSGTLQRLQIVKGWVQDGETQEQVYDIACSDGGTIDPATHRCEDNGATVNLETCEPTPGKGADELATVWTDPNFDASLHAFYYVRVLENPICRWSTWDAVRAGVSPRPDMHATVQDRAWSSPIWYSP